MQHPEYVDLHVAAQADGVGIGQSADGGQQTGVVDPQVDPVEPSDDLGGEPLDGVGVGDVHGSGERLGPPGSIGPGPGTQSEAYPLGGHRLGHPGPQAPAGPGDHGDQVGRTAVGQCGAHRSVDTKTFFTSL